MKIKELLTDESKWTQRSFAKTSSGRTVTWDDPEACCWCLAGAGRKCYGWTVWRDSIRDVIEAEINTDSVYFNDFPKRTFAEVKALVEKLDI